MMKRGLSGLLSIALAGFLVSAPISTVSSPAQAKITFHIEIGPGYGVRPLPGRFSCRAIGERLWHRGYNNIRVLDCRGSVYKFSARKDGWRWHLNVSSKTARILDRYRIAR
jgi:hypothetical protein